MKVCIWCNKDETLVYFKTIAHTIPKSLGGKNICENVCDECNQYFGIRQSNLPAVDLVFKEAFNITRTTLLESIGGIGRGRALAKFSSEFFKVNFQKKTIDAKLKYVHYPFFQENLGRQLKKGLYKIFIEETERQHGDGNNSRYDFIKRFVRYNLDDLPVFYFHRSLKVILMSKDWIENPELWIDEKKPPHFLISDPAFFEFELMGHVFSIATSSQWKLVFDNFIRRSLQAKKKYFSGYTSIVRFSDMDVTFKVLDEKE